MLTEVSISPQAPLDRPKLHALAGLALAADDLADALELLRHALVGGDDLVEGVGDLARDAGPVARQPHAKIPYLHGLQGLQQLVGVKPLSVDPVGNACTDVSGRLNNVCVRDGGFTCHSQAPEWDRKTAMRKRPLPRLLRSLWGRGQHS